MTDPAPFIHNLDPDIIIEVQDALLEIVRHRLACFQAGDFACKENESALRHVEDAIRWLNRRTAKRVRRGVEGKEIK